MRFHEIIGRATGNPLFGLLGSALRESLDLTIRAGFDSRHSRAELERVAEIHAGIAEAIATQDTAAARQWMLVHFEEARQFVLQQADRRERALRTRPARAVTPIRPSRPAGHVKAEIH